jgi:hypothetical protein
MVDGDQGVRTMYYHTWGNFLEVNGIEGQVDKVIGFDLSPNNAANFNLLVFSGQDGVSLFQAKERLAFNNPGFYETPGEAALTEVVRALPGTFALGSLGRVQISLGVALFGLFLYTALRFLGLTMISGLVLPIGGQRVNWDVYGILRRYLSGRHGPVIFVEGGQEVKRAGSFKEFGRGFIKVGAGSAVVIEQNPFVPGFLGSLKRILSGQHPRRGLKMRTEGAGIFFIKGNERLRGAVDLRNLIRVRPQVKAHTRDGIEVRASVYALFTLGQNPDKVLVTYQGREQPENLRVVHLGWRYPNEREAKLYRELVVERLIDVLSSEDQHEIHRFVQTHQSGGRRQGGKKQDQPRRWRPFMFDRQRVFAAIASSPYDVYEDQHKSWDELPAHMTAELFRKMLAQYEYDQLFRPEEEEMYPLIGFEHIFRMRMQHQGILAFQYVARKDGYAFELGQEWVDSEISHYPVQELQARRVLRSRGIKVITAGFTELEPTRREVQAHYLFDYWRAPWERKALDIKSDHELQAMRLKNQARAQAQRNLAYTLAGILESREYAKESSAIQVYQALEAMAADPSTRRLLPEDTIRLLQNLGSLLLPGEDSDQDKGFPSP